MGSAAAARGDDGFVKELDRNFKGRESGPSGSAAVTPLVVIAGVPGAGKTEALRVLRGRSPRVRSADPENMRRRLRQRMPWFAVRARSTDSSRDCPPPRACAHAQQGWRTAGRP